MQTPRLPFFTTTSILLKVTSPSRCQVPRAIASSKLLTRSNTNSLRTFATSTGTGIASTAHRSYGPRRWRIGASGLDCSRRTYATEPEKEPSPVQQTSRGTRDRSAVGVFTPTAAAVFILTGVGLYFYFEHEKQKLAEQKRKELESRKWGKAAVGGPFSLTTHDRKPFTEKDLLGKWSLVYFGFTNCPDICPEELDKMTSVVETLDKRFGPITQPIFISVDPARDSPSAIRSYLADFHPRLIGLSGSYDDTRAVCKTYRVYFSTPKDAKADGDYLVDHSIYFYLMDPEGEFVEAFGRATGVEEVVAKVEEEVGKWEQDKGRRV